MEERRRTVKTDMDTRRTKKMEENRKISRFNNLDGGEQKRGDEQRRFRKRLIVKWTLVQTAQGSNKTRLTLS